MRRRVAGAASVGFAITAGVTALLVHHPSKSNAGDGSDARSLVAEAKGLPQPKHPAFTVTKPLFLRRDETRARFAPVLRAVDARAAPRRTARAIAPIGVETPEGTSNIVMVLGNRLEADGVWVHVRLPVLPNNQTGWIPRAALGGYQFVHTHLVVDRGRLSATLFYDGRKVFSAPIGIGKPESPTPAGQFYVRDRLSGFGDPFYGPVAFGTSARSSVLTDWPGGGFVGIHGTNEPDLIPGRISHGCIRLRNPDIVKLSRLMPVGTPVTVR